MQKVFVFGSTGMLGRYVTSYLKKNNRFDVIGVTRSEIDAYSVDTDFIIKFLQGNDVSISSDDVVINCMGIIPQSKNVNDTSNRAYFRINSLFPNMLATACKITCTKYIHITTDCVFSGTSGSYTEDIIHDETNDYGVSKSLGELGIDATVIRTSIIGEELKNKYSLLEWVKSHRNKEIKGFTNHYWNGVTCLQLSKIIEKIIVNKHYWKGVRHMFSPQSVSKYEIVGMINDIYGLNNKIISHDTETMVNKTLLSKHNHCAMMNIPDLYTQITELQQYKDLC
jgi:dTDP-4-dehydrorhamnose reductase